MTKTRYAIGVLLVCAAAAGFKVWNQEQRKEEPAYGSGGGLDAMYQESTDAVLRDMAERGIPSKAPAK